MVFFILVKIIRLKGLKRLPKNMGTYIYEVFCTHNLHYGPLSHEIYSMVSDMFSQIDWTARKPTLCWTKHDQTGISYALQLWGIFGTWTSIKIKTLSSYKVFLLYQQSSCVNTIRTKSFSPNAFRSWTSLSFSEALSYRMKIFPHYHLSPTLHYLWNTPLLMAKYPYLELRLEECKVPFRLSLYWIRVLIIARLEEVVKSIRKWV